MPRRVVRERDVVQEWGSLVVAAPDLGKKASSPRSSGSGRVVRPDNHWKMDVVLGAQVVRRRGWLDRRERLRRSP